MATGLADIMKQLQAAQSAATAATEQRFSQGLSALTSGQERARSYYDQAAAAAGSIGRGATEDVSRGATRALAAGRQSLTSAGLGNTTIAANLPRGVEEDRRRAMQSVEEQQAQQRMGLLTQRAGSEMGAGGQLASYFGSRSDTGPDLGLYASLIQAAASSPTPAQGPGGAGSIINPTTGQLVPIVSRTSGGTFGGSDIGWSGSGGSQGGAQSGAQGVPGVLGAQGVPGSGQGGGDTPADYYGSADPLPTYSGELHPPVWQRDRMLKAGATIGPGGGIIPKGGAGDDALTDSPIYTRESGGNPLLYGTPAYFRTRERAKKAMLSGFSGQQLATLTSSRER